MAQGWMKWVSVVGLMISGIGAFASPVWTLIPLTSTDIALSLNQTAQVSYRLTNQSLRTHILEVSPQAGITQVTTDGNCANPVTLTAGQSCVLSLTVDGSAVTQPIITGPEVCEVGSRLACYQPSIANRLRITRNAGAITLAVNPVILQLYRNQSTNVTVANTDNSRNALNVLTQFTNSALDGLVTSSTCNTINPQGQCDLTLTAGDQSVPLSPFIIQGDNTAAVNMQAAISLPFAYVAGDNSVCPIASNGTLSTCQNSGSNLLNTSAIAINNQNTKAYVASFGFSDQGIYYCDLNQTNGSLSNCALTYPTSNVLDMTFNNDSSRLYFTTPDSTNQVVSCAVDPSGGLSDCQASQGFTNQIGIAIDNQNRYAYVVDANTGNIAGSYLSVCNISTTNQLELCRINPNTQPSQDVVLNNANTYAYITSDTLNNNETRACQIDATNGALVNCVSTATTSSGAFITGTYRIALNAANTRAYLTDEANNTLNICEVNAADNLLINCTLSTNTFQNPKGVALAH